MKVHVPTKTMCLLTSSIKNFVLSCRILRFICTAEEISKIEPDDKTVEINAKLFD